MMENQGGNLFLFQDGEPRGGRQAELESSNRWRAAPCPGENTVHDHLHDHLDHHDCSLSS